jgi:hypothetical protein
VVVEVVPDPGVVVVATGAATAVVVVVGAAVVVVVAAAVVVVVVPGAAVVVVVVVVLAVLAMKLFVMVAVQVTVLAPDVPDPLHWVIVVGRPVDCEAGAVTVQVSVPPAPPELLHWVTLWPPGPPLPGWLFPAGVAVQVSVVTAPGFWHCRTPAEIADPVGYPVKLLVTVAVHVTVLARPSPEDSHCVMFDTGVAEVVVPPTAQAAAAGHEMVVTTVANPVGWLGVAGL